MTFPERLPATPLHRGVCRGAAAARWVSALGWGLGLAVGLLWWAAQPAWAQTPPTLRVGVYQNEPKIFMDGTRPAGIFGDLILEIAEREGWTVQAVTCEWQACLDALATGGIDLMPDVAFNESRGKIYDFHRVPALHSWSQVYARPGSGVESVLDLQGKRMAVLAGSVQERTGADLLQNFGIVVEWRQVDNLPDGFRMVATGEADAVVTNHFFGNHYAPRVGLVSTPIVFNPTGLFFAAAKGQQAERLATIDRYLQEWKAQPGSVYFEILDRRGAQRVTERVPRAFWWGLAAVLGLLALMSGGALWLRRQVALKTRHLQASEARLNTILDSVDAAIFIKDPALRYQYVNRKVTELFGHPREAILGKTDADFFDTASMPIIESDDRPVFDSGQTVRGEEKVRIKGEEAPRTFLTVKLPLREPDGRIYALCGISTDLTDYRNIQAEIHQLAFYDPLTGLPNRRLLLDRLGQAIALFGRNRLDGALLFIDLDNFKILNDTLGHDMGDLLLQQMAQRLKDQVREQDTLARLGGDEFVVLITELHPEAMEAARRAENVAAKVLNALAQPYDLKGHGYECTVSIGVALMSDAGGLVEDILKRADMAMYEAKSQGRNTVRFFNPHMQQLMEARAALEADLREALAHNHFHLAYQPQVAFDGRVLGVEALLRWNHHTRGPVPPAQFIGVAEACGLILPIGHWVIEEACAQLARWAEQSETAGLRIAVNVSARQFRHAEFVNQVVAALRESGANPHRLELELTESQLLDDVDGVIAKMSVLRAHGVNFSLDDFGTGYSSLTYLKRLPLYKLKIDQSFVRDLLTDPNDAAIVRTIVALGRSLDLEVIAEGVETEPQRLALAQAGCDEYQGYLFGRPMPEQDLEAWLRQRPPAAGA
jgi:diguanylate cyclase (GGDEF)-like protein/PAS domain S-box-containing protein